MEPNEERKKVNDDVVTFVRKRSETETPHYTARLKTYVDFQAKRRRANAARRNSSQHKQDPAKSGAVPRKSKQAEQTEAESRETTKNRVPNEKSSHLNTIADDASSSCKCCGIGGEHAHSSEGRMHSPGRRRIEDRSIPGRSFSRSDSGEPEDRRCHRRRRRCRRRRRRSRRRRRRRRSRRRRCRRRRRRRSCRRRRRRRRRSCRRRRRRRSRSRCRRRRR